MSLENLEKKLRDLGANTSSDDLTQGFAKAKEAEAVSENYPSDQTNLNLTVPASSSTTNELNVATVSSSSRPQDLVTTAGSDATDLQSITGSSKLVANGELSTTATLPTAEAFAAALQGSTTATSAEVKTIVKANNTAVSGNIVEQFVGDVFNEATGFLNSLTKTANNLTLTINNFLNLISKGLSSILGDIIEDLFNNVGAAVDRVAIDEKNVPVEVPTEVKKKVAKLVEKKEIKAAAEEVKPFTIKTLDEIILELGKVKVGASDNLQPVEKPEKIAIEVTDSTKFTNLWKEENTDDNSPVFAVVGKDTTSITQLIRDFSNLARDVTNIVLLPNSLEVNTSISSLHRQFKTGSFKTGFPFHFFISLDGKLYRGRPLEINVPDSITDYYLAQIPGKFNFNNSITVYVTAESGINPLPAKTLTDFLSTILMIKPGIQVYDLNSLSIRDTNITDLKNFMLNKLDQENIPLTKFDPYNSTHSLPSTELVKLSNGD